MGNFPSVKARALDSPAKIERAERLVKSQIEKYLDKYKAEQSTDTVKIIRIEKTRAKYDDMEYTAGCIVAFDLYKLKNHRRMYSKVESVNVTYVKSQAKGVYDKFLVHISLI